MQVNADTKIQELKESILRTARMAGEDIKRRQSDDKPFDDIVKFGLWFEEKYKYRYRNAHNHLVVKKGEIYNCNFGQNIGSEQNKCRPAIILQNEAGNTFSSTTIVAPITDEIKCNLPTHVDLKDLKPQCCVHGKVLIEQIRCVSKNRLGNKLDSIDTQSDSWKRIEKAIMIEFDVISPKKSEKKY